MKQNFSEPQELYDVDNQYVIYSIVYIMMRKSAVSTIWLNGLPRYEENWDSFSLIKKKKKVEATQCWPMFNFFVMPF